MTGAEFKAYLERIGMSQVGAARLFWVNDRTVRRWVSGDQPVPESIAIILRLMDTYEEVHSELMKRAGV